MIKFTIITLFREAIEPYLKTSMMWKATEKGLAEFDFVDLREFGLGPHKSVDDTPYGGGDGMVFGYSYGGAVDQMRNLSFPVNVAGWYCTPAARQEQDM